MSYRSIDSLGENPKEIFEKVTSILMKLIENVVKNPTEPKYRKIRLENKTISTYVLPSIGGMECLFDMGFVEGDDSLILPNNVSIDKLTNFQQALRNKRDVVLNKNVPVGNAPVASGSSSDHSRPNLRNTSEQQQPVSSERVTATPNVRSRVEQFLRGMDVRSDIVCQYEDKELQLKALSCIPLSRIESNVLKQVRAIQKSVIKEGLPSDLCEASISEIIFLKELMKWFKHEFFKWVDSPLCSSCNCSTKFCKIESSVGGANNADRVEVYSCEKCNKIEKFPRYNNARLLLETRAGRCGEWGQCFTLFCRALKWDARFICDNTDHVWTEVYSQFQKKWLHCDPCECVIDKPLLYESGWKKKLDYIFAYSCDGVYDVTWRYSANHTAVLSRRNIVSESSLVVNLMKLIEKRRQGLSANRKKYLTKRHVIELTDFLSPAKETNSDDYEGRTSGSLAWRLARGEISVDSSYVWKPTSDEVSAKKMVVKYCPAKDEYVNGSGSSVLSRWEKGVFEVKNLFRKEELDWKMVYLCRTEGSSTGSIIWKFDFGSTGLVVDIIQIAFSSTTYKNGVVRLTVCGGDTCVLVNQENGGFETIALKGETVITLKAELEGGEGDVAWQHAQLFRMPVSDASCENYPFNVTFTLSNK